MSTTQLRALIVDDEPLAHEVILDYADEVPFLDIVGQCFRATEALERLNESDVDLLFLDIQMPRLGGLDLLRTLRNRPLAIVTSAHEEYALEGYELEVCDYLLKPFRFPRFLEACSRALARHQQALGVTKDVDVASGTPPPAPIQPQAAEHLLLKVDQRWLHVPLAHVSHLESAGNYVKVWTGKACQLTLRTLSSFEDELPADHFQRVHKSYIVSKSHVAYLQDNALRLTSGQSLPIGKTWRKAVWAFLSGDPTSSPA